MEASELGAEEPVVHVAGGVSDELPCAFAGPDRIVYLAPEEIAGVPEPAKIAAFPAAL